MRHGKYVKASVYKTKNNVYKNMEAQVNEEFNRQVSDESIDELYEYLKDTQNVIRLNLDFGFSSDSFYLRDTSNYIKALEDAVKQRIGIDDTRNVTVIATKHILPYDDWITIIKLDVVKSEDKLFRKWNSGNILGGGRKD